MGIMNYLTLTGHQEEEDQYKEEQGRKLQLKLQYQHELQEAGHTWPCLRLLAINYQLQPLLQDKS